MDACFVESQPLIIMNLDTEGVAKKFLYPETYDWTKILTDESIKSMEKNKDFQEILNKSFYEILDHKEYIYHNVFKGNDINNNINFPIHIKRITTNIYKFSKEKSDISPIEILEKNESLKKETICIS